MAGDGAGGRAVGRRSAGQDELQEASSASAAREEAAEYSDDFESDEDGMLNGVGEELNGSNSGAESSKKLVAVESLLSDDDDASQKAADLENEAADDLTLSFHEKKLQQVMLLESGNIQDDRKDEEECLKSQNEGNDRKNNEECSAAEEDNSESDHCNDLPVCELQKKRNKEESKPIPRPRVHKARNASASGISIFSLDGCYKPLPQPGSMLRKSGLLEDNKLNRSEGKITFRNGWSSFPAPSSQTNLNAQAMPKKRLLAESPDPEASPEKFSILYTFCKRNQTDLHMKFCEVHATKHTWSAVRMLSPVSDQDQKISTSDLKLEDNSRKSPSLREAVMTTVDEKSRKLGKSADDGSDEIVKIAEGQIITDTIQQVSVNDQSEHGEAKNTSKDSVKKLSETKERFLQTPKSSLSDRSLSPASLKKKSKAVPSATRISSQYLGTLKVLEDKRVQNNSTEFDKADSLRAAVFQNWLEKKRALLLELKRIEKIKAENLRNDAEKKEAVKREEAIASFEAWKKKKGREAKKLSEIKKVEELRKKKAAEETVERTEAAQKAFEKWKERKAEYLREQNRKEKQSERIRKKEEEERVAEKKRDSMSAVEKWNEKKEKYLKQKKVEKILERRKQEIQQAKKEEKDKKAMEEYERWLEKKEKREQLEKKQKKLRAVHGDEVSSPWSPPGKVTYLMNY